MVPSFTGVVVISAAPSWARVSSRASVSSASADSDWNAGIDGNFFPHAPIVGCLVPCTDICQSVTICVPTTSDTEYRVSSSICFSFSFPSQSSLGVFLLTRRSICRLSSTSVPHTGRLAPHSVRSISVMSTRCLNSTIGPKMITHTFLLFGN